MAQPAPYLAAYVFAIFSFWATASLALENAPHPLRSGALILIMILTAGVYESYPISLACFLVLCFYRRFGAAVLLAAGQITLTLVWKHIGLAQILGTVGYMESASSGASNLSHDIQTWWNIVIGLDFARLLHYLWVGSLAFVFGNVVFGAVAGIGLSVKQWRWFNHTDSKRCFWLMLMLVNSAMFAAMVFIVPQTFHWSPSTGMQPRLAFFSFALNLIAACYWMYTIKPQLVWSIPILSVFIANIDKTGFASIAMLFDYGALGLFWY